MPVINLDDENFTKPSDESTPPPEFNPLGQFIESVKCSVACLNALQSDEVGNQGNNGLDLELTLGNLSAEIVTGSKVVVVSISSVKDLNKEFGQTQVNETLKAVHSHFLKTYGPLGFTLLGRNFKQLIFLCPEETTDLQETPFISDCVPCIDEHISTDLVTIPEGLFAENDSSVTRNYLSQRYASFVSRIRRTIPDFDFSSTKYLETVEEVKERSVQALDTLLVSANQIREKFVDEDGNLTHHAFDLVRKNKMDYLDADSETRDQAFKILSQYIDLIDSIVFVSFYNQGENGEIDIKSLDETAAYWKKLTSPNAEDYTQNHSFLNTEGRPFLTSEAEFHRRCLEAPKALYCGVELVGLGSTITALAAKRISGLPTESNMRELLIGTTGLSDEMFNTISKCWQGIAAFVNRDHTLETNLLTSTTKGDSLTFAFPIKEQEDYQQVDMVRFAEALRQRMEEEVGVDIRTAVALSTRLEPGIDEHCAIVDYLETLALDLAKEFEKHDKRVFILFDSQKVLVAFSGEDGIKYDFELTDVSWALQQEGGILNTFIQEIINGDHVVSFENNESGGRQIIFGDRANAA